MRKKAVYFFLLAVLITVSVAVYLINPLQKPAKAGLQVITSQGSASLFLNDQYLDKTPYINENIVPGEYSLKIVPDNSELADFQATVELVPGMLTVVSWDPGRTEQTSGGVIYEFSKLTSNSSAEVGFISLPDGALIKFDDRGQEFTPVVFNQVSPGEHQFTASLTGYQPQQAAVNVIEGYRLNISVKLGKTDQAMSPQITPAPTDQTQPDATESAQVQEATASAEPTPADEAGEDQDQTEAENQVEVRPTNFFQNDLEVLRVRQEPNLDSEQVGYVQVGQVYTYLDEQSSWYQLEFTDALDEEQKTGWVSGEYLKIVK